MRDTVGRAKRNGFVFRWDIWNEPNARFWGRSRQQFFETWRRAVIVIRSLAPDAVIVGPSTVNFDRAWLSAFLDYAKKHEVLPDVLSWHENDERTKARIPAHVRAARAMLVSKGIDIGRFEINEMISAESQFKPGTAVWIFAQLEQERIERAAKACWGDIGSSNCSNASLNGLLTHPDRQPRPIWWAYRWYADITGRLVAVRPNGDIHGIAGYDRNQDTARLLLGNLNASSGNQEVRLVGLDRAGFPDGTTVRVIGVRADPHDRSVRGYQAPQPSPLPGLDARYTVRDSEVRIVVPNFGPDVAYGMVLQRAGAPSFPPPRPTSTRFQLGDRVQTTAALNVGSSPALPGTGLDSQCSGSPGIVSGGPVAADGDNWWYVDYDAGADGWSAERLLAKLDGNATVAARTSRPLLPIASDLVAHWKFDEGSGAVAEDSSGNGLTAVLNGPVRTPGRVGSALDFDGVNDEVTLPKSPLWSMRTAFTVAAWVATREGTYFQRIFEHGGRNGYPFTAYALILSEAGKVRIEVATGGVHDFVFGATTLPLDTWVHVAGTWDGEVLRVYVNGALDGSKARGGTITQRSTTSSIGYRIPPGESSQRFSGMLDELRLYRRALSAGEIESLYEEAGAVGSASTSGSRQR